RPAAIVAFAQALHVGESAPAVPAPAGREQVPAITVERVLVVHGDARDRGDRTAIGEGDACALVVHRVVRALAARHALAVARDDLAAADHRDAEIPVAIGEQIGTLPAFDSDELQPVILARRARRRDRGPERAVAPFSARALEPAIQTRELALTQVEI